MNATIDRKETSEFKRHYRVAIEEAKIYFADHPRIKQACYGAAFVLLSALCDVLVRATW